VIAPKQTIMTNQEAYAKAKKKVEARLGFYIHLGVYLGVCTLLTILNLTVASDYFWAIWPIIGWGSGVIVHALVTFVFTSGSGSKERMIQKEMQKGDVQ